jgi:hypothetical protein
MTDHGTVEAIVSRRIASKSSTTKSSMRIHSSPTRPRASTTARASATAMPGNARASAAGVTASTSMVADAGLVAA